MITTKKNDIFGGRTGASVLIVAVLAMGGCSAKEESSNGHDPGHRGPDPGAASLDARTASVPVRVERVARRSISEFLRASGTLEAENEVDLVARAVGPITAIEVEEGESVRQGTLMARIDDREAQNQVAIATVTRDEAKLAFDRARTTREKGLVSQEAYDAALSSLQAAEAQLESAAIELAYTEIRAPFDALVAARHVRLSQYVTQGTPLFRISDFTPLLCPIEVPEKDLSRLHVGQPARIRVEAFPDQDFLARVQRIRPTIDAATGTVTVTLEVEGGGRLRPGMFASVFLHTNTHEDTLAIPRTALVLDSIGDTVYVRDGEVAARRNVRLGIREQDLVEILEGLAEGDEVVVLGQDGLSDGTPVSILDDEPPQRDQPAATAPDPERLAAIRQRMRDRGMSDEEIAKAISRIRGGDGN